MTLGRFGNIYYFAVAVFFVAQIYGMPIGAAQLIPIFFGVLLAGTATAGASGIVTLSVISIALNPLSLPVEAILVILMAIDPIIDPFRTFYLVYGNIAATAMIAGKKSDGTDALTVLMRKGKERAPMLYHDKKGKLCGYEIALLTEIAHRLGKSLKIAEGALIGDDKADMIGGCVVKTEKAPHGFTYSDGFAYMREGGIRMPLCFLLIPTSPDSVRINAILKSLVAENFLTKKAVISENTSR
jgi:hypothetical protein